MAWITTADLEAVLRADLAGDSHVESLIDHAQGLCENEIGTQETPSKGLVAVATQITARLYRASVMAEQNPAGWQGETAGPFANQAPHAGAAGLGLTNREKADLRRAVGRSSLWVQPTTRGPVEMGSGTYYEPTPYH